MSREWKLEEKWKSPGYNNLEDKFNNGTPYKNLHFESYEWMDRPFVGNWLYFASLHPRRCDHGRYLLWTKCRWKQCLHISLRMIIRTNNRSVKSIFALSHVSIVLIKWNERGALNVATLPSTRYIPQFNDDFTVIFAMLIAASRHADRLHPQIMHRAASPPYKYEAAVAAIVRARWLHQWAFGTRGQMLKLINCSSSTDTARIFSKTITINDWNLSSIFCYGYWIIESGMRNLSSKRN